MSSSTVDPEVAQIAARTQASTQRRRDFAAALLAQVGPEETERLLRRYSQPLEEISGSSEIRVGKPSGGQDHP